MFEDESEPIALFNRSDQYVGRLADDSSLSYSSFCVDGRSDILKFVLWHTGGVRGDIRSILADVLIM